MKSKQCCVFGILLFTVALFPGRLLALQPGPNDVYIRIIDVGQGHCAVVRMPDNKYIIYDAGVGNGDRVFQAINETVEESPATAVELFVISHTDKDHLAAVPQIMGGLNVLRALRPAEQPGEQTAIWKAAADAIDESDCEKLTPGANFPIGSKLEFGEVKVTMVCGFSTPPDDWGLTDSGEIRNAGSIVIRLEYKENSVLLCGDTVGRHRDSEATACIAAERLMVENASVNPIRSDVIIAPHHGADNGSSTRFIEAVDPHYVVFAAGHNGIFRHPREVTAKRYLDQGVPINNIFRTDLQDDDGEKEWTYGRVEGHRDPPWDDDVEIVLRNGGELEVAYAAGARPTRFAVTASEQGLAPSTEWAATSSIASGKASSPAVAEKGEEKPAPNHQPATATHAPGTVPSEEYSSFIIALIVHRIALLVTGLILLGMSYGIISSFAGYSSAGRDRVTTFLAYYLCAILFAVGLFVIFKGISSEGVPSPARWIHTEARGFRGGGGFDGGAGGGI